MITGLTAPEHQELNLLKAGQEVILMLPTVVTGHMIVTRRPEAREVQDLMILPTRLEEAVRLPEATRL